MTDRALDDLIAAVEAGTFLANDALSPRANESIAYRAFSGDLNAAKALHEALLPERAVANLRFARRYEEESYATIEMPGGHKPLGRALNPARAWLIAILRALAAAQEKGGG